MDKKLAKENFGLNKHLLRDLGHRDYKHANKDINHIQSNLRTIRKEIKSGKAKRES